MCKELLGSEICATAKTQTNNINSWL